MFAGVDSLIEAASAVQEIIAQSDELLIWHSTDTTACHESLEYLWVFRNIEIRLLSGISTMCESKDLLD